MMTESSQILRNVGLSNLTALADHLPTGVAIVDTTGTQIYVNPAFASLVGWSVQDLSGARPPFVYWPPEELANIQAAFQETVAGDAASDGFELRFLRRDESRIDVRVTVSPLATDNTTVGWIASVIDITRQKNAQAALRDREERLRLTLDAGQMGAWDYDIASGRVTWSPTLERIHGLPEGSFGGTFDDYQQDIHPEDRAHVLSTIAMTSRGEGAHELLYRIVRPDGEIRWLEARGQLLLSDDGTPIRMVGVCMDATDRMNTDTAIRQARDEAERANRSKSEFLAAMSHELRTPLNAVGGYVDLIDLGIHGPVTDAQRHALSRVKKSQQHLLRLINDILHFAKIEAGHLDFELQSFAVEDALDELEPLVLPQAEAAGITYVHHRGRMDVMAYADPERVRQVLLNLLTNALKYTRRGGRVDLRSRMDDASVYISITDSGIGIPADRLEVIFDPFVQVDRQAGGNHHGVGLGLAISRDLARGMGGDVFVESEPGRGSTFTLQLPGPRT